VAGCPAPWPLAARRQGGTGKRTNGGGLQPRLIRAAKQRDKRTYSRRGKRHNDDGGGLGGRHRGRHCVKQASQHLQAAGLAYKLPWLSVCTAYAEYRAAFISTRVHLGDVLDGTTGLARRPRSLIIRACGNDVFAVSLGGDGSRPSQGPNFQVPHGGTAGKEGPGMNLTNGPTFGNPDGL
jgi:hypothetical protein